MKPEPLQPPAAAPAPQKPPLLFWVTLAAALLLFLLVFVAPALDNDMPRSVALRRLLDLFARDGAVRRTALASSVGLVVTAWIFFRDRRPALPVPEPARSSSKIIGA